ncbi:MAG: hypothetical protein K2Q18_04475, partial [Bdellovibrionales bacterium]|nr:hypothetical protein [Bdellovibrionales bacterium]
MKNKIPTILLTLTLTSTLFGLDIKIGNEIELDAYLNARTSPNFLKYTKNKEKEALPKGTTGEVVAIKEFVAKNGKGKSGNAGVQLKITNGPRVGQTFWVYYNSGSPALKIIDKKTQKQLTLKEIDHSIIKIDEEALAKMPEITLPEIAPINSPVATSDEAKPKEVKLESAGETTLPEKTALGTKGLPEELSATEASVESNPTEVKNRDSRKLIPVFSKIEIGKFPPMELPSFEQIPLGFNEEKFIPKTLTYELTPIKRLTAIVIETIPATRSIEEQVVLGIARETGSLKQDTEAILTSAERQRIEDCAKLLSQLPSNTSKENSPITTDQSAKSEIGKASDVYLPLEALEDLNSGELKFVGRDLMPGSGQNRSCIFENEKVYVIYHNCMSNKKEAPATDIEVLSKNGGVVNFYGENLDQGNDTAFSKRKRDDYAGNWSINS